MKGKLIILEGTDASGETIYTATVTGPDGHTYTDVKAQAEEKQYNITITADKTEVAPGDEVTFTDMDGTVHRYKVGLVEVLAATAVDEMNNSASHLPSNAVPYFNVDTGGYGEGWAIIFRPTDIQQYEGEFTVSITGIQTRAGADTTLEYTVEFFTPTCLRGHSYVSQTLEPTCTQPGQRFQTCTVCGKMTDAVELDPLGHDYARAVVEVTCDAPGTVTDTCSRCGDIVPVEETPALGHDWTAAPVCVDEAYHAVLCLRENCGAEKDSADHAMTFVVEDHLPYRVCTGCERRLSALTVTEEADAVTVTLDHVPQPLWVMAARYDGSHRLVSLRMEQFTQAGAHEFLLPAGEETRVFFLTERYVPFYLVK